MNKSRKWEETFYFNTKKLEMKKKKSVQRISKLTFHHTDVADITQSQNNI